VVIGLDDNDMITKVEDRWSGNDHPTRYGTLVRVIHSHCGIYYAEMFLDVAKIDRQGHSMGGIRPR